MIGEKHTLMATNPPRTQRTARYLKYALIILGFLLLVLVVFFYLEYRSLRRAQIINARELFLTGFIHDHGPLGANEAVLIRSWMTFDYINKIFKLPPDYLKTQLQIKDVRYPLLSLSSYAKSGGINSVSFLNSVTSAVQSYFSAK